MKARLVVAGCCLVVAAIAAGLWWRSSTRGPAAGAAVPLDAAAAAARAATVARLHADVEHLALAIGERHLAAPGSLDAAAAWIARSLEEAGHEVQRHPYLVAGESVENLAVSIAGAERPEEIVVVGAHYDTVPRTPGANDNASGVAVLLALARDLGGRAPARSLRLLFFVNEEPPHFQQESMGSLVYARECDARGEALVAAVSLDSVGYFSDAEGSQHLPGPIAFLFPDRGDFLAVAGDLASRELVGRVRAALRSTGELAVEGGSLPGDLPGVGWSDHWAFWQVGVPGVVVTDTALYRDPEYHRRGDLPARLDYERLGRIVTALQAVVADLTAVGE